MIRAVTILKRLARSHDLTFTFRRGEQGTRQTLRWRNHRITYRSDTSDAAQIERLLLLGKRCEYNLPRRIDPAYILDAGANIGLAAIFFSEQFPRAKIVSCEPATENLELLRINTAHLANVMVLPCALGSETSRGSVVQRSGRNYANATVARDGEASVPIYDYAALLRVSGVPFFDLMKIDIEGAEYGFLASLTQEQLAQCAWIVGEVHGVDEWRLLDLLSRRFAIDIRKTMNKKASKFHACNLDRVQSLLQNFDVSILQK